MKKGYIGSGYNYMKMNIVILFQHVCPLVQSRLRFRPLTFRSTSHVLLPPKSSFFVWMFQKIHVNLERMQKDISFFDEWSK